MPSREASIHRAFGKLHQHVGSPHALVGDTSSDGANRARLSVEQTPRSRALATSVAASGIGREAEHEDVRLHGCTIDSNPSARCETVCDKAGVRMVF
jgi:hypothetical protein